MNEFERIGKCLLSLPDIKRLDARGVAAVAVKLIDYATADVYPKMPLSTRFLDWCIFKLYRLQANRELIANKYGVGKYGQVSFLSTEFFGLHSSCGPPSVRYILRFTISLVSRLLNSVNGDNSRPTALMPLKMKSK